MDATELGEPPTPTARGVGQTLSTRLRDLRSHATISQRDIAALRFIGEGFEVAQYQLHVATFGNVSETVVSRFVLRASRQNFLRVERLNGMGMNRLRLTPKGLRQISTRVGGNSAQLFAPGRWVAPKDLAHTLWINDLRVVFTSMPFPPDIVLPAWAVQRMAGIATAIPDLVAIWKVRGAAHGLMLAFEIDLGNEPLKSVFLPKLLRLGEAVRPDGGERAAVVVLTYGRQRASLLQDFGQSFLQNVDLIVLELPAFSGRAALPELRQILGIDAGRLPS